MIKTAIRRTELQCMNYSVLCMNYSGLSLSRLLFVSNFSISNKKLGPLDMCVLSKLFLSLYLELSLSRIFQQKSRTKVLVPWDYFSLSISNFFLSKGPFTQQIEQKC